MKVTRGVVFSCYDVPGCQLVSATVEDGVIVPGNVPDEMDGTFARALGMVLLAAADELEGK